MFLSTLLFFIVLFGLMLGFVNTLTYLYITFSISLRNVIAWLIKIFKLKEKKKKKYAECKNTSMNSTHSPLQIEIINLLTF